LNASERDTFNFTVNTVVGDNTTGDATVESLNDTDNETVTVLALASFGVNVTDTNLPVGENEVVEVEVKLRTKETSKETRREDSSSADRSRTHRLSNSTPRSPPL